MHDLLKKILKEFNSLSLKKQNDIFRLYIKYIENYPDEHEEGNYPVSFLEWYSNDFPEMEEYRHIKAKCPKCGEDNNYRDGSDYKYAICNGCSHSWQFIK